MKSFARGLLLFLAFLPSLFGDAYSDVELEALWSSIRDINHPTLAEYRAIELYLSLGERPYLADLEKNLRRLNNVRNLKLVGPNDEMPIFEKYRFNITPETDKRCILIFSSQNGIYPKKARKVLSEIEACGYSGNVLLRIGGFPNTESGGIKLCHVPYAFKVAFLCEAARLGYKEVLWIDTAIHPLTNLELIFQEIRVRGWFFTNVGNLTSNEPFHFLNAAQSLGIGRELYDTIPHLASGVIGLNMENKKAVSCLKYWLRETYKVFPNINGFPEELSLAVAAWRTKCTPYSWLGNIVCLDHELPSMLETRPNLQFFLDGER